MISPAIDAFLATARHLNFTRAAQELYTTQPTISRQISALEGEWGFPLFIRSNKEVALTPEGAVMLDACRQMEAVLADGLARAEAMRMAQTGTLRVGLLSTVDEQRTLLPMLTYFEDAYPNIEVTVEKASYSRLREGLERDELDVIFTLSFEVERLNNVSVKCIEEMPCSFLLSSKHPLFDKPDLSLDDLALARFVLPAPEDSPRRKEDLENILRELGFIGNDIIYAANMESLMLYLNAGKAVALLNHNEKDFYSPAYRRLALPESPLSRIRFVGIWKTANSNPAIQLFV